MSSECRLLNLLTYVLPTSYLRATYNISAKQHKLLRIHLINSSCMNFAINDLRRTEDGAVPI